MGLSFIIKVNTYEIEIELINKRIYNLESSDILTHIHKMLKNVLCGLQNTNFPITMTEQNEVFAAYKNIIGLKIV